jgi:PAS domain S-box-containing protein
MPAGDTPIVHPAYHSSMTEQAHGALHRRRHGIVMTIGVVFFLLLAGVSIGVWRYAQQDMYHRAQEKFEREVLNIQQLLQDRLDDHVQVLYNAQGLFIASMLVERSEWSQLVNRLSFKQRFPGISFMAYIERVDATQKTPFQESVRSDLLTYPAFTIYPDEKRDEYFPIKYLEPFTGNEELLGWDLGYEKEAILRRVGDSGELAAAGRIYRGNIQGDYLFILPVYKNGVPVDTVKERRSSLIGFVALGIRPVLLLDEHIVLQRDTHTNFIIELVDENDEILWQRSMPRGLTIADVSGNIVQQVSLTTTGLAWKLKVSGPPDFGLAAAEIKMPQLILLGGMGFSFLIFAVYYLIASSRLHALALAGRMTSELGKFQLAVRGASNHIVITDSEGIILYANPAVEKTTGYSPQEIIGQTSRIWGRQMPPAFYAQLWKTIKENKVPYNGEITNRRKDGTQYDALVHISPILDKGGNLFGFVGIEEDITTRKRLEKTRSEFVSLVSHQLRTPLTAMRLALETLLNGSAGPLSDEQRTMLLRSKEYSVHMSETIFTMLTIAHLEAGRISIGQDTVNLKELFNGLRMEYEPEYLRKKQIISCDCHGDIVLSSDAKLLREVLANVISNAIKYTPDSGTITVKAVKEGAFVHIDVSDTVYGIPRVQQDRVFKKFFRGTNVVKHDTSGTGLGLYLVHSLITLLHGRVTFVSEENRGTTFSIFLPLSPSHHESKQENPDR